MSTETGALITRANHVRLDDDGDLDAVVERVVGIEDGRACTCAPRAAACGHTTGSSQYVSVTNVRIRIDGGAEFPT
jgi:hypothetical protein